MSPIDTPMGWRYWDASALMGLLDVAGWVRQRIGSAVEAEPSARG
jgi:hypothetical protein